MNDPHRLLLEYLLAFQDPEKASSVFADDGVFELPYLVSVGVEPRAQGRDNIRGFISGVLDLYPDFSFDAKDVTVLIDTPTQAFAEYVAHPTAAATGRQVHHLLMGRIVAVLRGVVHASLTIVSPGVSPKQAGTEAPPAKGAATGLLACVDERESRPAVLLGVHSRSRREGGSDARSPAEARPGCRLTSPGRLDQPMSSATAGTVTSLRALALRGTSAIPPPAPSRASGPPRPMPRPGPPPTPHGRLWDRLSQTRPEPVAVT